jgi:hypothetical protein
MSAWRLEYRARPPVRFPGCSLTLRRFRGLIVAIISKTRSMSGLGFHEKFSLTEHLAKIGEPPDRILSFGRTCLFEILNQE